MIVESTRFGSVEVDEQRVIAFPRGLLGFSGYHRYVLLQPNEEGYFFWLQSVESPELAFVVTDPHVFVPDYHVPIKAEQKRELQIGDDAEAQLLVIVNKHGRTLTGNLQGPLLINAIRRIGEQLVLSERRYHTRVPLMELDSGVSAQSA
jgi:flagellar assembly factor FliW